MRLRSLPVFAALLILLGLAAYQVSARLGPSTSRLPASTRGMEKPHPTRLDLELYSENRDRFVLTLGDSVPIDACINDGTRGDMYYFVHDCARQHPGLFDWKITGDGTVRLDRERLYAEKPGPFILRVSAAGFTDTLAGEILAPVSLLLSVYDTTLRVGDEIVVGSRIVGLGGVRPRTEEVHFYNPTGGSATWEEPLEWAYPIGMRLLARRLGVTCLALSGYNKMSWLRVAVVDSAGMSRSDGKPVDPKLITCEGMALHRGVAQPSERASAPVSALADSDVASGARKAFAFEVCVARRRLAADTGSSYQVGPDVDRCTDSVAALAPDWELSYRDVSGERTYEVTFARELSSEGQEKRGLTVNSSQSTVRLKETRKGPPFAYGMGAQLQGDEYAALIAGKDCVKLYRSRNGKAPRSVDTLIAFANTVWLSSTPGDRPPGCKADALRFQPRSAGQRLDSRVHESGRFTLRYSPQRTGATLMVRPVRWGETGVVSYQHDEPDRWLRTFENREPRPGDEFRHPERGYWVLPRSASAR